MKFSCRNGHQWKSERFQPQRWERNCPECGASAEPTLKAKGSGLEAPKRETPVEHEIHQRFSALVTEWPCFFRDRVNGRPRRPSHRCRGPIDPHHLVPVDYMQRELGLPYEVMYDPIIGVPLCRQAHTEVEDGNEKIYWDELDPECIAFCERHGLRPRLEVESPDRRTPNAA